MRATDQGVEGIPEASDNAQVNAALGTAFPPELWRELGEGVLRLEPWFNHLAGFTYEDDRLPAFFYEEPLPPKGYTARFRPEDPKPLYGRLRLRPAFSARG